MGKLADKEKYRQYKRKYALLNASDSESGGSEDTDEEEEEEKEEEDPGAESKKGSGLDRFALAMAKNGDVPTEEDRKAILRDLFDAKEEEDEEEEEEEEARGKGKAEPKGKEKAEPKGKEKAGPKGKEAMAGKGKEPMAPKRQGLKVAEARKRAAEQEVLEHGRLKVGDHALLMASKDHEVEDEEKRYDDGKELLYYHSGKPDGLKVPKPAGTSAEDEEESEEDEDYVPTPETAHAREKEDEEEDEDEEEEPPSPSAKGKNKRKVDSPAGKGSKRSKK
ncbi:hypothetical protein CYMTET_41512 [Cymbomonas tetramitiformis]|uniref:Uncharacterized protein n=1 Tax=Cymbomonas tetramitiformis TaxID=36881 RepID=A0AAE0C7P4_9CHLO|nr:hypothetical protein CYMTET_41512 [Cymbomonas tetramitiformis]